MIEAVFYKSETAGTCEYVGFKIEGHSGYSDSGSDIICAAVSSMVMVFINIVDGVFDADFEFESDKEKPLISFELKDHDEDVSKGIETVLMCISSVAEDYPDYVKVTETVK